jgi:hypothetical protein
MSCVFSRLAVVAALFGVGSGTGMAAPLGADFSYTADQDGGHALDADFSLEATRRLTLHAGAGHSRGGDETGRLTGNALSLGAALHGERAGLSLTADRFADSSNYQALTLAARAWLAAGGFEFAVLGRRRALSVDVLLELPLRTMRRELDFAATGAGLEVTFTNESFSAYAMAIGYDYDQDFDEFLDLLESPQLELRPRIEALVGSIMTQAQGAIDRQSGVGCEFGFGRHSLSLDLSFVHDAVLDTGSSSLALGYRRTHSAQVDWGVTAGMVDSDVFGGIGFLGLQIGLTN